MMILVVYYFFFEKEMANCSYEEEGTKANPGYLTFDLLIGQSFAYEQV